MRGAAAALFCAAALRAAGALPAELWRAALGSNASLAYAPGTGSIVSFPVVLTSPDAATVFVTEAFIASAATPPTYTLRVLALRAATGDVAWSWVPTDANGDAYNAKLQYSATMLSADGVTLFILAAVQLPGNSPILVAAVRAATGAVLWKREFFDTTISTDSYFNGPSLPSLSARGDLCLDTRYSYPVETVACLAPDTGVARWTADIGGSVGLDPSRTYLAAAGPNELRLYSAVTGILQWNVTTSSPLAGYAVTLTTAALYAIVFNKATNEAALLGVSLATGAALAGFPVALPATYGDALFLSATPAGALLVTRVYRDANLDEAAALALLSSSGVEQWQWVFKNPFFFGSIISADGSTAFVGSNCGSSDFGACTGLAMLYAVSLATGVATATAAGASAPYIYPVSRDGVTGGVVAGFPLGKDNYSPLGWASSASSGGFAWTVDQTAPQLTYVGQSASGALFFLESSSATAATFLVALAGPAPAGAAAAAAPAAPAALIGGVLGGAALAAATAFALRKPLAAALARIAGGGGAREGDALLGAAYAPVGAPGAAAPAAPRFMSGA
jgi:hypothetical protein